MRTFGGALFGLGGLGTIAAVVRAGTAAHRAAMPMPALDWGFGGIDAFGSVLFSDALAPFELSSALLMVAVVGAIAVARGRQGIKAMSRGEQEVAQRATPAASAQDHSGVFRHDIEPHAPAGNVKESAL